MNHMKTGILLSLLTLSFGAQTTWSVEGLDAATQSKVDTQIKAVQAWANDPIVVKAVKDYSAKSPGDYAGMDQDKWKSLTIMDPLVRNLAKNEAATFLKGKKTDAVTEVFLSGADGTKVAFLAKTTSWSHKGVYPKARRPSGRASWLCKWRWPPA